MKVYIFLAFFLFNIFFSFSQNYNKRIERKIKKIEAFNGVHIAISLEGLKYGKKFIAFNEDKYMSPASNTKLLTFLASINTFDSIPSIKYYIENDTILNFKSIGYPLLLHPFYEDQNLFSFLNNSKQLVYHNSTDEVPRYGPGWSWDDYDYYFSSEVSKFPIYGNVISIRKDSLGSKIYVTPNYFQNKLKVISDKLEPLIKRLENKNIYKINEKNWKITDTIQSPFLTSDSLFINLLSRALNKNINIKNENDIDSITNWKILYAQNNDVIYKALLQDSDNLIAESLLLMISKKKFDSFKSNNAINFFKNDWSSILLDPLIWVDGSGVSRYNLFTARTIISILKQIYKQIGWKKVKKLFPAGGVSGTIKDYYKSKKEPFVYAKTGTLINNHNLSGFLVGRSKKKYLFSIMVNHHKSSNIDVRNGIGELLFYLRKKL